MPLERPFAGILTGTCEIWRRGVAQVTFGANGKPLAVGPVLIAEDVSCRFQTGQGMSVPKEALGRADYDIVMTSDTVTFPPDVDVQDTDWLHMTTVGDTRTGEWWVVQGEPKRVPPVGRRHPGEQQLTVARAQDPPPGLPEPPEE